MSGTADVDTSTFRPVTGAAQEIAHTPSRHSGPRRWLRAVTWLIGAGLHPKATQTTHQVAEDLAARMDYSTGHVRYCLDEMVARLGIPRSTLTRHIAYLRELGALAWVQHGTRSNIRRALGLAGYAATATVYAAVIPPVYDHAMGHRIVGTGYAARVVIDQRGQAPKPVDTPGNKAVDNPPADDLETPSLTWVEEEGKLKMVGGSNYTSQARPPKSRVPHQSSSINGRPRTAGDVEKASKTTRLVRALVNWTQAVPLRRLEYVLRPWTDQGLDAYQIAADLTGMCSGMRWKPANPVAFIRARLAADREREQDIQTAQQEMARWEAENPLEGAFQAAPSVWQAVMAANEAGIARYQQQMRARGHEDLSASHVAPAAEYSDDQAAADMAAFLGSTPAPAG